MLLVVRIPPISHRLIPFFFLSEKRVAWETLSFHVPTSCHALRIVEVMERWRERGGVLPDVNVRHVDLDVVNYSLEELVQESLL